MTESDRKLFIVSNRLPIIIGVEDDQWKVNPSSGGLITALAPLMKKNHGTWLGWPGCGPEAPVEELLEKYSREQEYTLKSVAITDVEVEHYYRGFSNQTIWPLFHDLLGYCSFDAENWNYYNRVNERFAAEVVKLIGPDHFVWIHDYQLILVAHYLRELKANLHLNFFLHIPFPACDLLQRMPWRSEIVYGLLQYDHLGFQTNHDRRNFIQCVKTMIPEASVKGYRQQSEVRLEGRTIKLGTYPISIDFHEFNDFAASKEVADAAWFVHENLPSRKLVLGVDRLDYTKGIPERFLAFERALEKYPDLHRHISLVQIVVPSRTKVPEYRDLKEVLDTLSGRINGRFSRQGWVPIHYMFRELNRTQLLGYYRACEVALITPLRDGMNLVAKEYCASSVENDGILILSEFAGAADQLQKGALMVNPYDLEGTADAIYAAFVMTEEERRRRMRTLRGEIRRNDVQRWIEWFLKSDEGG
ncbi:MAG: trehalose-6-phosphate synthase [Candidatus Zixiibacteriota bacterium]|nr:MAG: trehalose-6-phosphate synthase [candidate division Zixibacteria bacterium]